MAQRKIDRFEQMSKQEELIAKKRREILEKQRTTELAKAVAMAMKESKSKEGTNNSTNMNEMNGSESAITLPQEENGNGKKDDEISETPSAATTTTTTANSPTTTTSASSAATTTTTTTQGRTGLGGRMGKILFGMKRSHSQVAPPVADQPPAKAQNSFCNDGSFLDHFKKIIEKQEKPILLPHLEPPPLPQETEIKIECIENDDQNNLQTMIPPPSAPNAIPTPVSVAVSIPPPQPFAFNPNFLPQGMLLPPQQPQHPSEQPQPIQAAFFGPFANYAPPPPPPPQIPISLANLGPLYMIPAPEPLQLSTIQAPKEFDLNAIPKPQLNLDAIQVPALAEQFPGMSNAPIEMIKEEPETSPIPPPPQPNQQQQHHHQPHHQPHQQQQQQSVLSDDNDHNCIQLPTTVENLIALVAENGDDYEEKIRSQKSRLHPAMWFLFDKHCQQYDQYQQDLKTELLRRSQSQVKIESVVPAHQDQNVTELADKYDPESAFGGDADSDDEYMRNMHDRNRKNLERRIEILNELSDADKDALDNEGSQDGETTTSESTDKRRKQRKSRWGEKVQDEPSASSTSTTAASTPPTIALTSFGNQNKPMLSTVTRTDPGLLNYARQNYGSTNLTEDDWKKCEEHYKVNLLYQDMMRKRQEIDQLAKCGKFKYEYDSDEDIAGGTWEHKLRTAEMEATEAWAMALTKQSEGKHHIGDFLPPEELKKFMEQYEAKKNNRAPDLSDYKEYKLKEDNIGFKMLQKLGWKEGQGLGMDGAGIVDPVNKAPKREGNQGLGVQSSVTAEENDNEYDAYRKRMMLAYRFRPNPLNNPRRAYY